MKLYELVGVKSYRDKDMMQLIKDISAESDSNLKKIGNGGLSQVFAHKSGLIYKFWAQDDAYEKFVKFVKSRPNDKHLPKFKSDVKELSTFFKVPDGFPEKVKYVKMEKLDRIPTMALFPGLRVRIIDVMNYIISSRTGRRLKDVLEAVRDDPEQIDAWEDENELPEESIAIIASLFDTITAIKKRLGSKLLDIHEDNIMRRQNGDIVITDPVADDFDITFNKLLAKVLKQFHEIETSEKNK